MANTTEHDYRNPLMSNLRLVAVAAADAKNPNERNKYICLYSIFANSIRIVSITASAISMKVPFKLIDFIVETFFFLLIANSDSLV